MKMLLCLALVASLPACATTTAIETQAHVSSAIARADTAFRRVRPLAEALLPYLPEDRAERVRIALDTAALWLETARLATTITGQLHALSQAEDAVREVETAATPAPD